MVCERRRNGMLHEGLHSKEGNRHLNVWIMTRALECFDWLHQIGCFRTDVSDCVFLYVLALIIWMHSSAKALIYSFLVLLVVEFFFFSVHFFIFVFVFRGQTVLLRQLTHDEIVLGGVAGGVSDSRSLEHKRALEVRWVRREQQSFQIAKLMMMANTQKDVRLQAQRNRNDSNTKQNHTLARSSFWYHSGDSKRDLDLVGGKHDDE